MIYTKLIESIASDFNVVCFADLAEISAQPYYLHRLLSRNYKESYDSNERFVFFSGEPGIELLLGYIKKTCDTCNISPSFVLIVSPYDLTPYIDKICDPLDKFDHIIADVDGAKLSQGFNVADTLCPLPWMHLAINPQGKISPCCVNKLQIGDITKDNIAQVFEGQRLKELRDSLRNGDRPESCMSCWKVEHSGGTSMRQEMLKWHHTKFFSSLIDAPALKSIDIDAGNTCNFKCRTCSEYASSAIAAEKLQNASTVSDINHIKLIQQRGRWFDQELDRPESKILSLFNTVEQIDFYGGEPFLLKGFERTLDYLIEIDRAKHVRLHLNTNCSTFPGDELLKKLRKFHLIDIGLSIDDVDDRFELIRGGQWRDIVKNINRYQQSADVQLHVHVYITISVLNVYYLDRVVNLVTDMGLPVLFNFVNHPEHLSIDQLTDDAKKLVLDKYLSHTDPLFLSIANRIQHSPGSDGRRFVEATKQLDLIRSQDFRKTHTEIAHAMGYM